VRVVKTVRLDHKRPVTLSQDGDHLPKSQADMAPESTNCYATNCELGTIPLRSSSHSAAADGASMPRCFRPSLQTATSNIPPSTKARL
jgi:hypothetical protein